jgi:Ulp1 family protease
MSRNDNIPNSRIHVPETSNFRDCGICVCVCVFVEGNIKYLHLYSCECLPTFNLY